jgi:hypothetical protein
MYRFRQTHWQSVIAEAFDRSHLCAGHFSHGENTGPNRFTGFVHGQAPLRAMAQQENQVVTILTLNEIGKIIAGKTDRYSQGKLSC